MKVLVTQEEVSDSLQGRWQGRKTNTLTSLKSIEDPGDIPNPRRHVTSENGDPWMSLTISANYLPSFPKSLKEVLTGWC